MERSRDSIDAELQIFVGAADKADEEPPFSVGITLWVEGAVVTGQLIGYKTYFNRLGDVFRVALDQSLGEEDAAIVGNFYRERADAFTGMGEHRPATMIHLDDARFFAAGQFIPKSGLLFRCKLEAVSAYSWGRLSTS